ncbi:MAG: guanosine monophosphate reductase, partial [Candidatus Pacebacteria bacterium CG10_big_fil_rev_8_21_14_0_10_42_12]
MLTSDNLSNLPTYLTYDDVLLLPNYSEVRPGDADLSAQLTDKIKLGLPVIASPMDTVCEERMAIEIAKLGGIGIIHKNLSVEEEANQVKAVRDKNLLVGASASMASDFNDRVEACVKAGASVICIDT